MPATVALRLDEFDAMTTERGWATDKERADGLGVSQSTISKLRSGTANPGATFIAACLKEFGPLAYARLFGLTGAEVTA
jgi:transcriptional regulator with XRE-family HTH domain